VDLRTSTATLKSGFGGVTISGKIVHHAAKHDRVSIKEAKRPVEVFTNLVQMITLQN
jgi:hypothetical protein